MAVIQNIKNRKQIFVDSNNKIYDSFEDFKRQENGRDNKPGLAESPTGTETGEEKTEEDKK